MNATVDQRSTGARRGFGSTRSAWRLVAAVFGLAWSLPAAAFNPAGEITAVCWAGEGCQCTQALTPDDVFVTFGWEAPVPGPVSGDIRGTTVVIDVRRQQVYRSTAERARIHAAFGGNGDCPLVEPQPIEPRPLDGTWQWRGLGDRLIGCPALMASTLSAMTQMAPAARVDWGGELFDPARFAGATPAALQSSPYRWRKIGLGRWITDNVQSASGDADARAEVGVVMTMTIQSPERVTGLLRVRSIADVLDVEARAALASFGMDRCEVRRRFEIVRTGP